MNTDRRGFLRDTMLATGGFIVAPQVAFAMPNPVVANDRQIYVPQDFVKTTLCFDINTGEVLFEDSNRHTPIHPASLTKLFDAVAHYDSKKKSALPSDILAHHEGELLGGALVPSNNACAIGLARNISSLDFFHDQVVAAGHIPGTEQAFCGVVAENIIRFLDLQNTRIFNASGLPPYESGIPGWNVTTADSLMKLVRYLILHYPEVLDVTSQTSVRIGGAKYLSVNPLLPNPEHRPMWEGYPGVDGLKTGFINKSLKNTIATARLGKWHLCVVSIGCRGSGERLETVKNAFDTGYLNLLNRDQLRGPNAIEPAVISATVPESAIS